MWLASSPDRVVEWSSSGLLLEVCMSHPWFCTLPEVGLGVGGWVDKLLTGSDSMLTNSRFRKFHKV